MPFQERAERTMGDLEEGNPPWSNLPPEIWLRILNYVPELTVAGSVLLVNRSLYNLAVDESLWKAFASRRTLVRNASNASLTLRQVITEALAAHNPRHTAWVLLGHVDAGKSTLCGKLVCARGGKMAAIQREDEEVRAHKFKYTDKSSSIPWTVETSPGQTIDYSVGFCNHVESSFAFINSPGRNERYKNLLRGITLADYGLLVVSASEGEFEASVLLQGGKTREHMALAKILRLTRLVVAINKADSVAQNFSARYQKIVKEGTVLAKRHGIDLSKVTFVPISALKGDNILEPGLTKFGDVEAVPSLWEALAATPEPERKVASPLRMTVHHCYQKEGGIVLTGRVLMGYIKTGDRVLLNPPPFCMRNRPDLHLIVESIEQNHEPMMKAIAGDIVGVKLRLLGDELSYTQCYTGMVISQFPTPERPDPVPLQSVRCFMAQILILKHGRVMPGCTGLMICHAAAFEVTLLKLTQKCNKTNGARLEDDPEFLLAGDRGKAIFAAYVHNAHRERKTRRAPHKPDHDKKKDLAPRKSDRTYCVDTAERCPNFGRFIVYNSNRIVLAGMIEEVNSQLPAWPKAATKPNYRY